MQYDHWFNDMVGIGIGLQFDHAQPGGLLAPDWRSRRGLPVINVAGCPAHPHTMTQTLAALAFLTLALVLLLLADSVLKLFRSFNAENAFLSSENMNVMAE